MIRKTLVIISIPLFIGCEREPDLMKYPDPNQVILFQVEYVNYAWGYQHNGFLIDSSGIVWAFKKPSNWRYMDSTGYISESAMQDNIKHLDTLHYMINKSEMLENFGKIPEISKGVLSKPYNAMFDAGVTDYIGFLYEPENHRYKKVLIKRSGDWTIDNNSHESEAVFNWLLKRYLDLLHIMNNK
jgi:hypothetical protein